MRDAATTPQSAAGSTASAEEVARYNALAAQWWDPAGPMWPLHKLNALRAPFILDCVARLLPDPRREGLEGLRVLDVGCGAGLLAEAMARAGARVTGVDPAERNIAIAREHAAAAGLDIDYRVGAVESLPDGEFDLVLNMEVVEHVTDLPAFMASCCALTRPGGMQFVATINRNPLSFVVAILGAEYVLRWLPRGTHDWRQFVTPAEAEALLAAGGFEVLERRGVSINPLTKRYRLSDFLGVNYMIAARRGD
jgi:2-polyprenyl-6-hydroxyphenyl methylase/3-demethylubiquinone-9 3-methyltransferase